MTTGIPLRTGGFASGCSGTVAGWFRKKHFYKKEHDVLKNYEKEMSNYNVKDNLTKYAKNDAIVTLKWYKELNKICHLILKCDILKC